MKVVVDITNIKTLEELKSLTEKNKGMSFSKEGLETTVSGLDVVEPTMYDTFLNMSCHEFGRFIRNWIRRHLKDEELCVGQVERIFQTPVSIYKQQFSRRNKK